MIVFFLSELSWKCGPHFSPSHSFSALARKVWLLELMTQELRTGRVDVDVCPLRQEEENHHRL